MKLKIHPLLKLFLKLLVTAVALFFVIRKLDFGQMKEIFARLKWGWIILSLVAFVISKWLSALRLHHYFRAVDVRISPLNNLKLYLLGMYYNLFLPGGIGGDGYKIWLLGKQGRVRTSRIFWAVMMDRVIGVLALFCLAVIFFYFTVLRSFYPSLVWLLIPLSIGLTWWISHRWFSFLSGVFIRANLLSLLVQLCQVFSALFILRAMGVQDTYAAYVLVFLLSSIVAVLPFTIGGLGAREFTFMLGAKWLVLDLNVSIALSFLFYLITVFTSFWGIVYSLGPPLQLGDEE